MISTERYRLSSDLICLHVGCNSFARNIPRNAQTSKSIKSDLRPLPIQSMLHQNKGWSIRGWSIFNDSSIHSNPRSCAFKILAKSPGLQSQQPTSNGTPRHRFEKMMDTRGTHLTNVASANQETIAKGPCSSNLVGCQTS